VNQSPGLFCLFYPLTIDRRMNGLFLSSLSLGLFVTSMTSLAAFWIFRVPPFRKILLRRTRKHEFFPTFRAYEDLWLKTVGH